MEDQTYIVLMLNVGVIWSTTQKNGYAGQGSRIVKMLLNLSQNINLPITATTTTGAST